MRSGANRLDNVDGWRPHCLTVYPSMKSRYSVGPIRVTAKVSKSSSSRGVGYHSRHADTVGEARRLLHETPCRLVIGAWLDRTPRTPWWSEVRSSGGQLVEQATHLFHLTRILVGDVVPVQAVGARGNRSIPGDIDQVAAVLLRFANGAVGTVTTASVLRSGYRIGLELVCDGRVLALTERDLTVDDGSAPTVQGLDNDPIVAETLIPRCSQGRSPQHGPVRRCAAVASHRRGRDPSRAGPRRGCSPTDRPTTGSRFALWGYHDDVGVQRSTHAVHHRHERRGGGGISAGLQRGL